MITLESQTEYWKSMPERITALHRRIVASDGLDEHELRGETADLLQTLSNRLELALRRTADRGVVAMQLREPVSDDIVIPPLRDKSKRDPFDGR